MTTFSLNSDLQPNSAYEWSEPEVWQQGRAPDDPSDQVFFGYVGTQGTSVDIQHTESISIGSLAVNSNELLILGQLTSAGNVTVNGAPRGEGIIEMGNGILTAQSMHLIVYGGGLDGAGMVNVAGPIYNDSTITARGDLTLKAAYFDNTHTLLAVADGVLTVETTLASGFANYESGTLVGGQYVTSGGTIDLGTPGVIHSDAADLIYQNNDSGVIASYDPSTGQYVSLESSLTLITASGGLEVDSGGAFAAAGSLTVAGNVTMIAGGTFSVANTLYITSSGSVDLTEAPAPDNYLGLPAEVMKAGQIIDDGKISIDGAGGGVAKIDAAIQGTGTILVGPAALSSIETPALPTTHATVELTRSVTGITLAFADGTGTAILDTPGQFTGHVQNFEAGDTLVLSSIAFSSVTGFSYSGNALTIHENGTVLHLAFTGDYTTADFSLQAAANGAGTAIIGIAPATA